MSYQKPLIIDDDETADIPVIITTIHPSRTVTTGFRWNWMVAVAAGTLLLVVSGTVLMQDSSIMNATEGLVVATEASGQHSKKTTNIIPNEVPLGKHPPMHPCFPANNGFQGHSKTTFWGLSDPFQTCFQLGNDPIYLHNQHCYTNSHCADCLLLHWFECVPDGEGWRGIDTNLPLAYCDASSGLFVARASITGGLLYITFLDKKKHLNSSSLACPQLFFFLFYQNRCSSSVSCLGRLS